jgi:hypothetical protein
LFGRLKDTGQNIFKHFGMGMSKFEIFKEFLSTDKQKNNTQWRSSITTQERLALTLRSVHIQSPHNLLSPPSAEQLNTSQKAAAFWLKPS